MSSHISVLRDEVVQAFDGIEIKTFFDGTLGAGGHAKAILEAHPEIERYVGCDRDPTAHDIAKETLAPWEKKLELVRGSYSDIEKFLDERGIASIDGFLIDIGVSSMQLDGKERGFSFRFEGPLDMRMDPDSNLTAEQIVNEYNGKELEKIFREYGEESQARRAAEAIVFARKKRRIETTNELIEIVKPVLKWGKLHPATLIFQALRIVVNDELGELERGLEGAIKRVSPGGRLAVISFHSLEDRIVKHRLKDDVGTKRERGILEILTKRPIVPTEEECKRNPRSRSAKLRVAEKRQIV
jgi:16S rRNA (cytosine1402-N4)-methyltransferase